MRKEGRKPSCDAIEMDASGVGIWGGGLVELIPEDHGADSRDWSDELGRTAESVTGSLLRV